jgi:hypothetical protein
MSSIVCTSSMACSCCMSSISGIGSGVCTSSMVSSVGTSCGYGNRCGIRGGGTICFCGSLRPVDPKLLFICASILFVNAKLFY